MVQKQDTMRMRTDNELSAERECSASALITVQQRDSKYIQKKRLQNDVASQSVART